MPLQPNHHAPYSLAQQLVQGLRQPDINLQKAGRPSKAATEEGTARMKSFLEDMREGVKAATQAVEAVVAGGTGKGRGGPGIPKKCKQCQLRGRSGEGMQQAPCAPSIHKPT
jgi:hypothetical protein